jgi:hypothetical protein
MLSLKSGRYPACTGYPAKNPYPVRCIPSFYLLGSFSLSAGVPDLSPARYIRDLSPNLPDSSQEDLTVDEISMKDVSEPVIMMDSPAAGWTEIRQVVGRGESPEEGMTAGLEALKTVIEQEQGVPLNYFNKLRFFILKLSFYFTFNLSEPHWIRIQI